MTYPTPSLRTSVYVDGFNLYYAIKDFPNSKWLNILGLCRSYLPTHDIQNIKYFTSTIRPRPNDPDQHIRQLTYIQALETLPELTVIYGHFLSKCVNMVKYPITSPPKFVVVLKTEEKGSDVNLAAHMLNDAHFNRFDVAVLISNDSDLLMPITMVRELGKQVVLLIPPTSHPSKQLKSEVDSFKSIRKGPIQSNQFPPTIAKKSGKLLSKPAIW